MKKIILTLSFLLSIMSFVSCQKDQPKVENASQKAATERILVEVKTIAPQIFNHYVAINGAAEAIQDALVSPELNGQIKKIHVAEGQRVKKGELLISLNADAIRSGIAEAKSGLELASTVYERRRELWEKKIGSEIQFLEAKTTKVSLENRLKALDAQLQMAEIHAPISGIVDAIGKKEGELALPGMELMHLINLQRVRINAEMAESFLSRVKTGDAVEVTFPTYPDRKDIAKINRISQAVNPKNRTVIVVVELDNADELIKPNMMASLQVIDFTADSALLVPTIIVKNDMQGRFLYVIEGMGDQLMAKKTYVEIGMTQGGDSMVTSGLSAGQQVIVAGYNLVNNGMPVRLN